MAATLQPLLCKLLLLLLVPLLPVAPRPIIYLFPPAPAFFALHRHIMSAEGASGPARSTTRAREYGSSPRSPTSRFASRTSPPAGALRPPPPPQTSRGFHGLRPSRHGGYQVGGRELTAASGVFIEPSSTTAAGRAFTAHASHAGASKTGGALATAPQTATTARATRTAAPPTGPVG